MSRDIDDRRFSRRKVLAFAVLPLAVLPIAVLPIAVLPIAVLPIAVLPIAFGPASAIAASSAESYVSTVGNGVLAAARSNSVGQFRALLKANADIPTIAIYSLGPYRK